MIAAALLAALSAVAATAAPGPPAPAAPLVVSPPARIAADGRAAVPLELTGGPEPLEGEDQGLPDRGSIACPGAGVVAAGAAAPARVIAPASPSGAALSCVARRRGVESAFSLQAEPPSAGLYAALSPGPEAGQLLLAPFRVQPDGRSRAPLSLQAAASAGSLQEIEGRLRVVLPPGRAPRALAVALLDGEGEGAVFLPLPGRTQLHLESKRRSLLSVRVAGALFGPVRAPEGKATLPVLVPPGTRLGVVRAVDRLGNAKELPVDLETPELPRLAAAASGLQVVAGGELRLAVALAAPDGAPAEGAPLRASAARGSVEAPAARASGLWTARYRAPAEAGSDRIAVSVAGDPAAGQVELAVEVVAGPPARIALELPRAPPRAGEELVVHASVRDATGNALSGVPLQASLAGAPLRVSWEGALAAVSGAAPRVLPAGEAAELVVQSGASARAAARLALQPAEAATADLRAESSRRTAVARALVKDRFGNALGASGFSLLAEGARVGPLRAAAAGAAEADLDAAPRARAAEATVIASGRVLAHARVAFDPPPDAWLGVARGDLGGVSNGGALRAPRLGVGLGLRRQLGRVEWAALLGLDLLWYRDQIGVELLGAPRALSRHLTVLAVPLLLRARLPFARRWGVALEAGPVPTATWASASSEVNGTDRQVSLRPGFRARAAIDFSLGRGRLELGASVGAAKIASGPLGGSEVEGRSLFLGYEAWWHDFGP